MAEIDFNNMTLPEAESLVVRLADSQKNAAEAKRQTPRAMAFLGLFAVMDAATGINALTHGDLKTAVASGFLELGLGFIAYLRIRVPNDQLEDISDKQALLHYEVLPAMRIRQDISLEQRKPKEPRLN